MKYDKFYEHGLFIVTQIHYNLNIQGVTANCYDFDRE